MAFPSRHVCLWVISITTVLTLPLRAAAVESNDWRVHVGVLAGFPASPTAFRDDSKPGIGVAAGVRRALTGRWSLGLEGEFAQFGRGDIEGSDLNGGARRFGRIGVPLRVEAWQHLGERRTRFDVEVSAGYAHASRASISGTALPPDVATRGDGVAWTAGGALSGLIFETTRLFAALRATGGVFPDESPVFIGLVIGIDAAPARR